LSKRSAFMATAIHRRADLAGLIAPRKGGFGPIGRFGHVADLLQRFPELLSIRDDEVTSIG
jgi:hypothetical protein